jgi:prolyl-tRNA editing enzyme YbaK/EbsC (Cys-tRNA(Pro) deacylase)
MHWPEPVERFAEALVAARIESHIEELSAGPVAEALGAEPAQIVDTHVFDAGGRTVVALVPGGGRIDPDRLVAEVGMRAEPGRAAPALPPREGSLVLADRTLLAHERVWIAAGSPRHFAALSPSDLIRVARAKTVELVRGG